MIVLVKTLKLLHDIQGMSYVENPTKPTIIQELKQSAVALDLWKKSPSSCLQMEPIEIIDKFWLWSTLLRI